MTDAGQSERDVERIVEELKELSIEDRVAFIDEHCRSESVRNDVLEKLAILDADLGDFLASPAFRREDFEEGERRTIGPYRLLQELGEGGFGIVYLAEQERPVRRQVALKLLKPGMDSREIRARFEAERQALAMMNHPNIATVLDIGTTDEGNSYFVMELVKGVPINEFCDKSNLSPRERLEVFRHVCRAVEHAHQKGILHRDIKPSNILVTLDELSPVPKVIDFGVAKALNQSLTEQTLFTRHGQMVGTPAYMSPEQAERSGLDVDTRSDVYSLGVVLYELLTGTTPIEAERLQSAGFVEIQRLICEEEPPTPSTRVSSLGDNLTSVASRRRTEPSRLPQILRGELDWIVMRALEKDRTRRYQSASALSADIHRYLCNETVEACPPTLGYRLSKFVSKHRATLGVAATIVAILAVATTVSVRQAIRAGTEADKSLALAEALEDERQHAVEQAALWRSQFYGANLIKAHHFLEGGNGGRASEALDECPEDLRGWEWDRLKGLADQSHPPLAHGVEKLSLARFSPDGRRIVSTSTDGTIRLWDAEKAKVLWTTTQPEFAQLVRKPPAFSPDGNRVVTTTIDWIVIRSAFTGEPLETFEKMTARAFRFSKNGLLALVSIWEAQPAVFNADSGTKVVLKGSILRSRYSSFMASAAFNADGSLVATGRMEGKVNVWDSFTGERKLSLQAHGSIVSSVAFSSDGKRIISGSWDRSVKQWDLATGNRVSVGHVDGMVYAVAASPDGRHILSGGTDSTITIWNAADGEKIGTLNGHRSSITSLQYSADGKMILSASDDGTIRTWDRLPPAEYVEFFAHSGPVEHLVFSPDGTRLVSCGRDKSLRIWEWETGRTIIELHFDEVPWVAVFSPDGRHLACGVGRADRTAWVSVRNADTGELVRELRGEESDFLAIDYSPDGSRLAASGSGRPGPRTAIYVWDATTGDERLRIPVPDSGNGVQDLAFSSDGRRIVAAVASGNVSLWDAETGALLRKIGGPAQDYCRLALRQGGPIVAATSMNGNDVHVWNADSGELVQTLSRHTGTPRDLTYGPDGRRLFTAGTDDTLRIWDTRDGEELMIVETGSYPMTVAVSPDGATVVAGGASGKIRIWSSERKPRR